MKKKTHAFTAKALTTETPKWAKIMFRVTFVLTSAVTVFVGATNLINEASKYEIMLGLKALDVLIYGFSKMFGIEKEDN